MEKHKSQIKFAILVLLLYLVGILSLMIVVILVGKYDLKFQNLVMKSILFGLIALVSKISFQIMKKRKLRNEIEITEEKKYFLIILIPAIILAVLSCFPLEKQIGANILCEDKLFEDGYTYYEKKNIIFKEEIEWDVEHDIRILKEKYGVNFTFDELSSAYDRRYIPENNLLIRIEILEYPTIISSELRVRSFKVPN